MAIRIPLYIDFAEGHVKELEPGDTIDPSYGGGASAFTDLSDVPASYAGQALKAVRVNAGETALEFVTLAGGGDMLAANNLSDVANAATSRQNLGIDTTANQTDSADKRFMTDAQEAKLDAISGTNTGDQTSIVGISGTKAQFDTACSDGNFLYSGDVTQYTDELAQDAVGNILSDAGDIDFTYDDATPAISAVVKAATITEAKQVLADNTTNDVSTTKHGYVPKAPNDTTKFLRGDATWASPSFPRGHIWGLIMSNAADTANDITVSAGEARDEENSGNMTLSAPITKRLDAAWAVGDNQGGLNTGVEANSTWYEVHLIKRNDTGVVDVMFTTTANRDTLPTNYNIRRRIGWIRNSAAGSILQFVQINDHFTLVTPVNDVDATATASATSRTLTAPPNSIARFRASTLGNTSVNAANAIVFSELVETDTAPTTTNGFNSIGSGDFAIIGAGHIELRVNSSSQIRDRAITATGTMAYDISTFGWIDNRLRLSST